MVNLESSPKSLQKAVGGRIQVKIICGNPRVIAVTDLDGASKGKGKNRSLPDPQLFGRKEWNFIGDCVLCGSVFCSIGADFTDLPESMILTLLRSARENYESQNH